MNRWLMVALCVVCSTPITATPERNVRVVVEFGQTFAAVIGQNKAATAKAAGEAAVGRAMAEVVPYFKFVPSPEDANLSLRVKIDNLPVETELRNVNDYYAFLSLYEGDQQRGERLHWLFRDASDSANGAENAIGIAESLAAGAHSLSDKLIEGLFSRVSFTNKAVFTSGPRYGWLIEHARNALCMHPETELVVESEIPDAGFQESFIVKVKRRSTRSDNIDMLSHAHPQTQLDGLTDSLDGAAVVAVRVQHYARHCDVILEASPSSVEFAEVDET